MKYQMPPDGTQYRSIEDAPAELTKEWYTTLSHLLTLILLKYGPIYIPREEIEKDNGKFRVFLTDDKTGYTIHLEKDVVIEANQ